MSEVLTNVWESLNASGYLGYIAIFTFALAGYSYMKISKAKTLAAQTIHPDPVEDEDDDIEPPRNFTLKQLLDYDGTICRKFGDTKPIYLSVAGKVFDVSEGKDFYGPDSPYELFAGHECGVALAKMSFDNTHLDDIAGCKLTADGGKLNYSEKDEMENWSNKFEYFRSYPVVGALIADNGMPDPNRIVTKDELAKNNGKGLVPDGYASAPLYVGAKGKVFDVSFGGVPFYGEGCPYHLFVGVDASRALALMSLDKAVAGNPDISDLTEKQMKTLNDWVTTFEEKKLYPVVGRLEA